MKTPANANWLWVPPGAPEAIKPPIDTRPQQLPLNELSWPDFQRICARLAQREGDVEFVQEYGIPGQKQDGIDIYIRKRSTQKYAVWQCKRYQKTTASDIKAAVDEFLKGDWVGKTDEFALCITCLTEEQKLADEIEKQSKRLKKKSIANNPLGVTQLSNRLKNAPSLVDDFFGREWVRQFCGEDAATQLGKKKLTPSQVGEFRTQLRHCYLQHFESVDPGLPFLTSSVSRGPSPLPLTERFVLPDILEVRQRTEAAVDSIREAPGRLVERDQLGNVLEEDGRAERQGGTRAVRTSQEFRRPALGWLTDEPHSVIIGEPGMGKSALLRYLVLDLLSMNPVHEKLAQKWGHLLPVWVPFAMWVRLVVEDETKCSLEDVLVGWLNKVCAPPSLVTLVVEALNDSRLLLLVDGLDEWVNETSARTTLALLEQFIGSRSVPAVVTCRPLGFQRLGGLSNRWRRGHLAGFTRLQQSELSRRWFRHQQASLGIGKDSEESEIVRYADNQSNNLIQDIQKDSQLAILAETPLMLSGLIALSAQQVQLPRSRFKAYSELTKLLLQEQPRRRDRAAHARQPSTTMNPTSRERALACLAFEIHGSPESISLERDKARRVLQGFFVDTLSRSLGESGDMAEQMIAVGAESVGILVEKAQDEIGFLHRTFQEFLAACHLKRLPFARQREFAARFAVESAWQNVFLSLFSLNDREDENDQMVADIEALVIPPEAEVSRLALLSELAFAEISCSPETVSRLADGAFREIEFGSWMPLRRRILGHALNGYHSDLLRSRVASRIQTWYPCRHQYLSGVFTALAKWPVEEATTEAFFRWIQDEEEWSHKSAAEALAEYAHGDQAILKTLLKILTQPHEPRTLAYALHAVCLGWPDEGRIPGLLDKARKTTDATVGIVATFHRVQRSEGDTEDRQRLVDVGSFLSNVPWRWREDAAIALAKGWPGDDTIKKLALESFRKHSSNQNRMDNVFAVRYLLSAYPQDDEVAETVAEKIRDEQSSSLSVELLHNWQLLVENFSEHPIIQQAAASWFKMHSDPLDHRTKLLGNSEALKQVLLGTVNNPTVWGGTRPIRFLVNQWGADDAEVLDLLTKLSHDPELSPLIADLLPHVIPDRDLCRKVLLGHLRDQAEHAAGHALAGLVALGCKEDDREVVDAALSHWDSRVPCGTSHNGVRLLIRHFPRHPAVRCLALHQLRHRGGDVAAVAESYKDDADMRARLLERITPLPTGLRMVIVDWFERQAGDDEFADDSLSEFDEETDKDVKTAAAIAHAKTIRTRGTGEENLLAEPSKLCEARGMDFEDRREAAFAALLELERTELMGELKSPVDDKKLLELPVGSGMHPNMGLARQIASHWDHIVKVFGDSFWERSGWVPDEMLEEIVLTTKNVRLKQEILAKLTERGSTREPNVPALNFLAKELKGTDELRDRCLKLVLESTCWNYIETNPCIRAAEILGEQFSHDHSVREAMGGVLEQGKNVSAAVIALCEGWPDSECLKGIDPKDRSLNLLLPARIWLMTALDSSEKFIEKLHKGLPYLTGDIWEFLPISRRAIERRFVADGVVRGLAIDKLESDPTSATMAVFSRLLHRTDTRHESLRTVCAAELSRQMSGDFLPDLALDIEQGVVRPLAHVLLDVLSPLE